MDRENDVACLLTALVHATLSENGESVSEGEERPLYQNRIPLESIQGLHRHGAPVHAACTCVFGQRLHLAAAKSPAARPRLWALEAWVAQPHWLHTATAAQVACKCLFAQFNGGPSFLLAHTRCPPEEVLKPIPCQGYIAVTGLTRYMHSLVLYAVLLTWAPGQTCRVLAGTCQFTATAIFATLPHTPYFRPVLPPPCPPSFLFPLQPGRCASEGA